MKTQDIKNIALALKDIREGAKKEMTDMEKTRAMASNPPKKDKQDTKNRPPSELMNQNEGAKQGKPIKGTIQPGKRVGMKDDASNDMSDDGEGLDKADPKAAKKKFKDRKDKDIDNDGDVDSSDKFLHKRRKAVSKAIASKKKPSAEKDADVEVQEAATATQKPNNGSDPEQGLSPNAKRMMAMKTDAPEGADITKVAPKTFAAMRASGKKAAMRNNDNPQGDKTPPKNDGK